MTTQLGEPKQKPVGIWVRVSTEDQARGDSPEHHEQRARLYAASQRYEIKEVYRLDAVSGKSVMDHPETKRMLADIRSSKIEGLIFSKLARLARNTRELLDFADIFRQNDAALISLQESLDTGTPAGRFFYTVIGALAEWERQEIADRVAASVAVRAKLGKPLGGRAPFGFAWKDRRLVFDEKEAHVRKLIYEWYGEHRRKKTVAQMLNARGYRTRAGKPFSAKVLEDLIRDPTAKGLHRANYSTRRNGGKHEFKPEDEWVYTRVEPIVSEELWERCNHLLMSNKTADRPIGPRPEHLFGGKVRCTCGTKMYARKRTGKYVCDKCNTKIPANDLESVYCSQLKEFLFSDAQLAAHVLRTDEELAEKEKLIENRKREGTRVQGEIDRLFQLYFDGEIPKEGFGKKYAPLEHRQKQIDADVATLQAEIDSAKIIQINRDHVLNEARNLNSRWPELSPDQKKTIVQMTTDEVIVGKDEIEICLAYLPTSPLDRADKGTDHVGSPLG